MEVFFNDELKNIFYTAISRPETISFFREFKIQDAYLAPYSGNYKVLLGIVILM